MKFPYRVAAPPPEETKQETLRISRMANWNDGKHFSVDWVLGSRHVEISLHDGSGASRQRVRIGTDDAQILMSALSIAIREASEKESTG